MTRRTFSAATVLFAATMLALAGCETPSAGPIEPREASPAATSAGDKPAAQALDARPVVATTIEKLGFITDVQGRNIWVLKPGQTRTASPVTLEGVGPKGMNVKAVDRDTALEYIASRPGFVVEAEDGRLWILRPGQEKTEKRVTRINAGPLGTSLIAHDAATLDDYLTNR